MSINNGGFGELQNKVRITLEQFVRQCCEKIRVDAKEIIRNNKTIATGQLDKNITTDILITASRIVGVVGVNSNVLYGIFVHEGTRPHFPPVYIIQQWIIQKGLLKNAKGKRVTLNRLGKKKNYDEYHSTLKSIAFLIARKIAKKGTVALPFLRLALNQNIGFIQAKLAEVKI